MMETVKELNAKIMEITLLIQKKYPELSKYLKEMPITIPNKKNLEIMNKNLKEYYESLESILKKYVFEQSQK